MLGQSGQSLLLYAPGFKGVAYRPLVEAADAPGLRASIELGGPDWEAFLARRDRRRRRRAGGARGRADVRAALAALGEELVDSDRPLVTVSGTPYVPGRASTEADPLPTDGPVGGRSRSVMAVLGLASRGVRSSAVRLPGTVDNEGRADSPAC